MIDFAVDQTLKIKNDISPVYSEILNLIFYTFFHVVFSWYEAQYQNTSVTISMLYSQLKATLSQDKILLKNKYNLKKS